MGVFSSKPQEDLIERSPAVKQNNNNQPKLSAEEIINAKGKGGAYIYANIYKWFTETSGLGLAELAAKLMNPAPAKKEEMIAECIDQWEERCSRLSSFGPEHELGEVYKTAALKKILVGEAVRNFEFVASGQRFSARFYGGRARDDSRF